MKAELIGLITRKLTASLKHSTVLQNYFQIKLEKVTVNWGVCNLFAELFSFHYYVCGGCLYFNKSRKNILFVSGL